MSNVHNVTYGNMLNESLLTSASNFDTIITLCSRNTSIKSSKILKWNAGVKIYKERKKMKRVFLQQVFYGQLPSDDCAIFSHD